MDFAQADVTRCKSHLHDAIAPQRQEVRVPMMSPRNTAPRWQDRALSEMNRFYHEHDPTPLDLPRAAGAPIFLKRKQAKQVVLLLHGFLEGPSSVQKTAEDLFHAGFSVYAPRLDGHGNSPDALAEAGIEKWIDTLERSLCLASECEPEVLVMGVGLGAPLALSLAANRPEGIKGVILKAPVLCCGGGAIFRAKLLHLWNGVTSALFLKWFTKPRIKAAPLSEKALYEHCPVTALLAMHRLIKGARKAIRSIAIPTLILQDPQGENPSSCLKHLSKELTTQNTLENSQQDSDEIRLWSKELGAPSKEL